jgi:YHS domain-containing protein
MFTTLLALTTLAGQVQASPIQCPVASEPIVESVAKMDYAGVRFGFCCAGCVGGFADQAEKLIAKAAEEKRPIGVSLFDPVAGTRIESAKAKGGFADYKGTRFYFATEANRTAFEAKPAQFGELPKKEALYCAVMKHGIASYAAAGSYTDFNGVRYYMCCPDCQAKFVADPGAFAKNADGKTTAPKAQKAPKAKP